MKKHYQIYQIRLRDNNEEARRRAFMSWRWLQEKYGRFDFKFYDKVYEGEVDNHKEVSDEKLLDTYFWHTFNRFDGNNSTPQDYHGRSLSESDVVVLDGVKYYCDSIGWQKIEESKA